MLPRDLCLLILKGNMYSPELLMCTKGWREKESRNLVNKRKQKRRTYLLVRRILDLTGGLLISLHPASIMKTSTNVSMVCPSAFTLHQNFTKNHRMGIGISHRPLTGSRMAPARSSHQEVPKINRSGSKICYSSQIDRGPEAAANVHHSSDKSQEFRDSRTNHHLRQCVESSAAFPDGRQRKSPWQRQFYLRYRSRSRCWHSQRRGLRARSCRHSRCRGGRQSFESAAQYSLLARRRNREASHRW